ncbi:MAG: aldehyde dehydrogenase [Deltaproteobacteria bacterium CG11_big_fil_rev_8_21_14_0_20_42_23]|nr:MAG: aldehyde dehydrogenase [Deltaproteobacteria bacterium CG11_big_fil_rev_8_21_14_0_20_42_23]PJC64787.1 MAG: aldehyde dehydrogenase [Deltaproteobacteria bacterium CG_4_9_14_0_2_um_filter_42_21]
MKKHLYIAGNWEEASNDHPLVNSYTQKEIERIPLASAEQVERSLAAAEASFSETKKLSVGERKDILHDLHTLISHQEKEYAECISLESGKAYQSALGEVKRALATLELCSEELNTFSERIKIQPKNTSHSVVYGYFPIGPVLGITPFNFPLNLVMHKLAPALAVGNPIIIKAALDTPGPAMMLARDIGKTAWPKKALSVLTCKHEQSETLVKDDRIKKLSFTGSAEVGWKLKTLAGKKKVTLELGGNAGVILCDDANVHRAAKVLAMGAFGNAGQSCISTQHILVQDSIYETFLTLFVEETNKLMVGDPLEPTIHIGTMIHEKAASKVESWIEEALQAGASAVLRGKREGNLLWPTILKNVPHHAKLFQEEVFGPVVHVSSFSKVEKAFDLLNASRYGLSAAVWTEDEKRKELAFSTLEYGQVIVNDSSSFRDDAAPYGGVKDSGIGREGPHFAMREMCEIKALVQFRNQ